jgi:hypothetical protein
MMVPTWLIGVMQRNTQLMFIASLFTLSSIVLHCKPGMPLFQIPKTCTFGDATKGRWSEVLPGDLQYTDHGVFIWKKANSELFHALATEFLSLKAKLEAIFEVTLQEGSVIHFLNLCIIQSPIGISIDQTDHIVETIVEPYSQDRDT